MSRFRGARLALLVLAAALITVAAPGLFDGIDGRVGSYLMVGVAGVALAAWLARRRRGNS